MKTVNKKLYLSISIFLVLFSCFQEDSSKRSVKNYTMEQENEMGYQCNELYNNAINFLINDVSKLIQSCKKGEDGISLYHKDLYDDVHDFNEKLFECKLRKSNADRVEIEMDGYFEELSQLYNLLEHVLTKYRDEPLSVNNLSPSVFLGIETYYQFFVEPSEISLTELNKLEVKEPPVWVKKNSQDLPIEKWLNKKFIFSEQPKSLQKYGYTSLRLNQNKHLLGGGSEFENEITRALKYEMFVGKIISVIKIQNEGKSFAITFEEEKTKRKIFAETYKGHISGIAYLNDLIEAKNRWNNKTIYSKIKTLYTYDATTGEYNTIKIEIGEPLKVIEIVQGFLEPVWLYCETSNGQIGFISTAYSWTNQYFDDWSDMRPWEYKFFDEYPDGNEWDEENWNLIKNGEINVGMTKEQVLISWGRPGRIVKTSSPKNTEELWHYIHKALLFNKNILISISPRK